MNERKKDGIEWDKIVKIIGGYILLFVFLSMGKKRRKKRGGREGRKQSAPSSIKKSILSDL